jgi:hypothetical protein
MKATIIFLLTILCFVDGKAQAPTIQWQKSFGGTAADNAYSIESTPDGGYVVTGFTQSNNDGEVIGNHGGLDYWVIKLDAIGTIQWKKCFGGSTDDYAFVVKNTSDGGFIVAGQTSSTDGNITGNHGDFDCGLVKLDANGNIQWQKSLGGSNGDYVYSIQPTPDGGYFVGGVTTSTDGNVTLNHGESDYWAVKLDATGTIQWQKSFGGSGLESVQSVQTTSDGGYVMAGFSQSTDGNVTGNHGDYDCWIVKLNANGTMQWQKSLGGSGYDAAFSIQTTSDGGYVVAGKSNSTNGNVTGNHGYFDYWVLKLNSSGNVQWQKSLGGSGEEDANSIQKTADGGYVVAGFSDSVNGNVTGNHGDRDFWVVKLNAIGNIQWQQSMGGTAAESALSIQATSDGGYVLAGYSESTDGTVTGSHGGGDFWVVKLGYTILDASVFDKKSIEIFPNPVCDVLQFQIPQNTIITKAKIIDINGKLILEQSVNNATINVEDFTQGIYILELYSGEEKYSSKFIKE